MDDKLVERIVREFEAIQGYRGLDHERMARAALRAIEATRSSTADAPVPMLLYCPQCGLQHIDEPDERTPDWDNPPHKSHLCHGCGCIWRPADVPTEGVAAIKTAGKADTWFTPSRQAERATADDALRDDAEWLVTAAGHLQRCCEQSYSRSTMTPVSTGTLVDIADRLERIASRLRPPSPDGEVTEDDNGK